MHRITQVGVLSLGKIMGAAGALLGVVLGLLYGIIFGIVGAVGLADGAEEGGVMLVAGAGMCIGVPLAYGALSFLFGLLYGVILNLVFGFVGGLELRIEAPGSGDSLE
ncbi:MAG: hypothetical protein AAF682_05440 [Planctomycetota bacterium]